MPRISTCQYCGASIPAGERGLLPRQCSGCKRVRLAEIQKRNQARRNARQKERRRKATIARLALPPEPLSCEVCGVTFPRPSRKGTPPRKCPVCTCFFLAIGRAQRQGYFTQGADFTSTDVFEQDGYICYLCGGECSGRYPDPMSPSIDHVQPIARGGQHRRDNVRTAHLLCNMSKGIREPQAELPTD